VLTVTFCYTVLLRNFLFDYNPSRADRDWFSDFASYIHSRDGVLLYQAAPFAPGSIVVEFSEKDKHPECTADGFEVYNHRRADICCNHFAADRAEYFDLGCVSGSDLSYSGGSLGGGILTEAQITSDADLVTVLRSRKYLLAEEAKKNV